MKKTVERKKYRNNDRERKGKPGRDCRGSSLIEVIVAMLILSIIVVSALEMFSSAARINGTARKRQYANAVLENVLEEIRANNYVFSYEVPDAEAAELRDSGRKLRLCCEYADDGDIAGRTYLTGVMQQGTREYQAKISFRAGDYQGENGLNDYAMPDINSYDSSNSEMLLLDASSDQIIVEEFYRQYLAQEMEEYQQRLNQAWLDSEEYLFYHEFDKWYDWWLMKHDEEPPEDYEPAPFLSSSVEPSNPLLLEEFRLYIKKQTEIKISSTEDGDYEIVYTVLYKSDAEPEELHLETEFEEVYEYQAGSGSRFTAEQLKYIYVFYQPFSAGRDQEELIIDANEISREEDWKCRIFLAIQGGASSDALKVSINMDKSLSPSEKVERLEVLSAGGLICNYPYVGELVPTLAPENKVYRVTVQIMEAGTDAVIAEADTTVYHE